AAEIEGYDHLDFDNRSGIIAVVDELVSQGRRHIAIMTGDLDNAQCVLRLSAFREGLAKHGIELPDRYIMQSEINEFCREEAARLIDGSPEIDAIVCINDIIASVVYEVIRERGKRIGTDIAVTGFDDLPVARELSPQLATVRADPVKLGARAVEKAYHALCGIPDDDPLMPTDFIRRQSCMREEYDPRRFDKLEENELIRIRQAERDRGHVNDLFMHDAMMFSQDLKNSYDRSMKRLSLLGARSGFLYTLDTPAVHIRGDEYAGERSWHFRSYCIGEEVCDIPDDDRIMTTADVFDNKYLCTDRQRCFIAADLYAAETQYGLMLIEPEDTDLFNRLEMITYVVSAAVRTLDMIHAQERLVVRLQTANLALQKESQVDELTGVYNRRGFYSAADTVFERRGRAEYLVCYADMDDLKIVNDLYGHIEGDMSLKRVTEYMREVFGAEAVLGRLGGDEFAALVPSDGIISKDSIGRHMDDLVAHFNMSGQKPYLFGISMGITEHICENVYDLKAALDAADDLLYACKQRRKQARVHR
ncbi:MAG: GGDEF domain-containing protein, partial [Oscillospiraceae bacterium]|nr:GGDEF domain-containing protein [Oscillospiraceae bacterium]